MALHTHRTTAESLAGGAVAWLCVTVAALAIGLAAGVWEPAGLTNPEVFSPGLLVPGVVIPAVVVGGSVALALRYGLVLPVLVLVGYLGWWTVTVTTSGMNPARAPFVAVLYSFLLLPVLPVAAAVEYAVRWLVAGRGRNGGDGRDGSPPVSGP